jgi:hypothetical protein
MELIFKQCAVRCELYASGRARGVLVKPVTKNHVARQITFGYSVQAPVSCFTNNVSTLRHEIFTYVRTDLSLHELPNTGTVNTYP